MFFDMFSTGPGPPLTGGARSKPGGSQSPDKSGISASVRSSAETAAAASRAAPAVAAITMREMLIALTEKTDRNRIPFRPAIHLQSGVQATSTAAPAPSGSEKCNARIYIACVGVDFASERRSNASDALRRSNDAILRPLRDGRNGSNPVFQRTL